MAAKEKAKKKTRSTTARNKTTRVKKTARNKGTAKQSVKKKAAQKKARLKRKVIGRTTVKTSNASEKQARRKSQTADTAFPTLRRARAPSGVQSGDLQGLSRTQGADSESVDELLEEGNPFEASVVTGVQDAEDAEEKEVRTHEVLEDDVPDEYLDKE